MHKVSLFLSASSLVVVTHRFPCTNLHGLYVAKISTYRFIVYMHNLDIRLVRDQTRSADVTPSVTGKNVAQFSQGAWRSLISHRVNSQLFCWWAFLYFTRNTKGRVQSLKMHVITVLVTKDNLLITLSEFGLVYGVTCDNDLWDNNFELTNLPYAFNFGLQSFYLSVLSRKLVTFHFTVLVCLVMVVG